MFLVISVYLYKINFQVIVLLGTAVHDENCSDLLCQTSLPVNLIDLLKTYQEDDEIVLQIIYIFMILLSHDSSADHIINNTGINMIYV